MAAITLKDIPEKLYIHVLKVQSESKIQKKVGMYSQESAVLKIIEEHKELKEKKNQ